MSKKLIFLDIDGTLTEAGTNVPPASALEAIKATQAKGNKVLLCTGRNPGMLRPLLEYGFDGYIGSAGGYISYQDQVVFDCPMTETQRIKVLTTLKDNGIFRTVECLEDTYTDDEFKEFLAENAAEGENSEILRWRKQIESSLNIKSMAEYDNQPVYKLVFMCIREEQVEAIQKELGDEFLICVQDRDKFGIINGEIINRKFDKGQAVERVSQYTGISMEDTIAFGDSMNDREMIEVVAVSVCMENGSETLKKMADYVCPKVQEDGLKKGFTHLNLI